MGGVPLGMGAERPTPGSPTPQRVQRHWERAQDSCEYARAVRPTQQLRGCFSNGCPANRPRTAQQAIPEIRPPILSRKRGPIALAKKHCRRNGRYGQAPTWSRRVLHSKRRGPLHGSLTKTSNSVVIRTTTHTKLQHQNAHRLHEHAITRIQRPLGAISGHLGGLLIKTRQKVYCMPRD